MNLKKEEYKFSKLKLSSKLKKWMINTVKTIPAFNLYTGVDDERAEDLWFCVLGKELENEKWFYAETKEEAVFEASHWFVKNYKKYLKP